jgi:hypothetical protein
MFAHANRPGTRLPEDPYKLRSSLNISGPLSRLRVSSGSCVREIRKPDLPSVLIRTRCRIVQVRIREGDIDAVSSL